MRMKNDLVIKNFINHCKDCTNHSKSLRSENGKLMNYGTCIAQYIEGKLFINVTKYSSTTSTHQNRLKCEAYEFTELHGIQIGTYDLKDYAETLVTD